MGTEQGTLLKASSWSPSHPTVQHEVKQGPVEGTSLMGWDGIQKAGDAAFPAHFLSTCVYDESLIVLFNPECDKSRITHAAKEHNPHSAPRDFLFLILWELPS